MCFFFIPFGHGKPDKPFTDKEISKLEKTDALALCDKEGNILGVARPSESSVWASKERIKFKVRNSGCYKYICRVSDRDKKLVEFDGKCILLRGDQLSVDTASWIL